MRSKGHRSRQQDFEEAEDAPASSLRARLSSHPRDAVCLVVAVVGVGAIMVNALFLQNGRHPAPIFSEARPAPVVSIPMPPVKRQPDAQTTPSQITASTARPTAPAKPAVASPTARPDPIADLLEPANRTIAVQRALAEFGYGQIKPNGTVGPETKAAIERFERERKLPVTGQISERLMRELGSLKGGPL